MTKRRDHGDGAIDARGDDRWRLRYRINNRRFSTTFRGTQSEARRELRRLLRTGDVGAHVAPDRITVAQWIDRWLALLDRKPDDGTAEAGEQQTRRRGLVNPRTAQRYGELLKLYIVPTLGNRPLQKLAATEIDNLYVALEKNLAPRTVLHAHTVLKACLNAALRKGLVTSNPASLAEAPVAGETDAGMVLDEEQLGALVRGFRGSSLYLIVATACFTGARRNEILGLRWFDLDASNKTLRIARAVEETKAFGRCLKEPKTARGKRTIQIDDDLIKLLVAERERHLRVAAGVPDQTTEVDLSLVKLLENALIFPAPAAAGEGFDFAKLRDVNAVTRGFKRIATKLGFSKLRFHDLRRSHETCLLDQGVPVHVVAARAGHDAGTLLRSYARRTKKADTSAAAAIGALSKGILGA
jgi:integrase